MNDYIYEKMNCVTVKNDNSKYEFNCVTSFDEYDHEIVVTSNVQIDCLKRGYIGDLFYHTKGHSVQDARKEVTTVTGFKEVLLARITVSSSPGYPIEWKYTFLKD